MSEFSEELRIARDAAWAGAQVVSERFGESRQAQVKGASKGIVTETDPQSESAILEVLSSRSSHAILCEESGVSRESSGPRWVVGPLDGTTNFSRSLPLFAVSVALVHGSRVLASAIVDPVRRTEFCAELGGGAFCNSEPICLPQFNAELGSAVFVNHGYGREDRQRYAKVTERLALVK